MPKKGRKKETLIEFRALGWDAAKEKADRMPEFQSSSSWNVNAQSSGSWEEIDDSEKAQKENFLRTQIRYNERVEKVDTGIRMAHYLPSVLKCPIPQKHPPIEREEIFRRNYLPGVRFEVNVPPPRRLSERTLSSIFKKHLKILQGKMIIKDQLPDNLVFIVLGPAASVKMEQRYAEGKIKEEQSTPGSFKITPNMVSFMERNCYCLSSEHHRLIILFVDKKMALTKTLKNGLREQFGVCDEMNKTFDFSLPGRPYAISFANDREPVLLNQSRSIYCIACTSRVDGSSSLKEYFENKFSCQLEARPMSIAENKLFNLKNETSFAPKSSYVIKFYDYKDKQMVLKKYEQSCKEWNIVDGSMDNNFAYESLSVDVRFNTKKNLAKVAMIRIKNPNELQFTEKVLTKHNLRVAYKVPGNISSLDGKYIEGQNELFISYIPLNVKNTKYLQWFVDRILKANKIEYTHISFDRKPVYTNRTYWCPAIKQCLDLSPELKLRRQLVCILHVIGGWHGRGYSQTDIEHNLNADVEYPWIHEECKPVINDIERDLGPMQQTVRFFGDNVELGHMIVYELLERHGSDPNFLFFTENDHYGPDIMPKYRKLYPISKDIRKSVDSEIVELDLEMRELMRDYERSSNECMTRKYSDKLYLRIVEQYDDHSEDGLIGIEGWDPRVVKEYIPRLLQLFEPIFVDCSEAPMERLLYGIGEAFVRNLINLYNGRVVVDFDRFRRRIYVFGTDARNFVEDICEFERRIPNSVIVADFAVTAPYFNDVLRTQFERENIQELENDLDATIYTIKEGYKIHFEGSIGAFNVVNKLLFTLNQSIFEETACYLPDDLKDPKCPICRDDCSKDFYRLEACGHVYCRVCLNNYLTHTVNDYKLPCKCIFPKCMQYVIPTDVKRLILGGNDRVKRLDAEKLQFVFNQSLSQIIGRSNGRYRPCSVPDCVGLLQLNEDLEIVRCSKCAKKFCGSCLLEPHDNMSCNEYKRLRFDAEASVDAYRKGRENVGRCPKLTCGAVIEKELGCNHMECSFCQTHFCWECQFAATSRGEIYAHLSDVHGTTGGEYEIEEDIVLRGPENDFELDREIQNLLLLPRRDA